MTSRILIGTGALALSALAFAASLLPATVAPATAESLDGGVDGGLAGFYIVDELPGLTILNLESGPATTGTEALLLSGPVPTGSTLLFPGTNLVAVPTSSDGTYTAIGPAFGEARVTSAGGDYDPGDH